MAEKRPMAFMSYAHVDDKFNKGYLTEFCLCLSGEICMHLGEEFPIFLDRKDIKWGDSWKVRIEGSIDGSSFLIPIITPGFFKSQYCRDELSRFLEREKTLGRADLIRPVYFIDTPLLEDEMKRNQDELAEVIASRQYADWRKLRFEELDSGAVRRALAELASQIRDALDSFAPASEDRVLKSGTPAPVRGETKLLVAASEDKIERRKQIPEPPTIVVDQWHRGDFTTISQAIKKADPGSRILVHSGIYDEGLILDKPLEIVGDGNLGDVTIRAEGKEAILFKATIGKVANLVLRQMGGGDFFCVNIKQGLLELEGCDITSNSNACVAIYGKAFPKLRGNKIHDGKQGGIFVYESGQGLIEDNDIFGNALSGIDIKDAGNPTVRRNKIHDGKQSGIFVHGSGQGLIEDNDIFGNANSGIQIKEAGNPTVRGNKIHDGKGGGIYVYENGQGLIEDNDIFGNASAGITIGEAGNPTVRGNRINKNVYEAVWVHNKGAGIIENNDLRQNKRGAWDISDDSRDLVKRSGNQE